MIWKSLVATLDVRLEELKNEVHALLDVSTIVYEPEDPNSPVVMIRPHYGWGTLDHQGVRIQAKALKLHRILVENIRLLLADAPANYASEAHKVQTFLSQWIERTDFAWSVPRSISEAKQQLDRKMEKYSDCFAWMKSTDPDLIIVPDTNALMINPELHTYGKALGATKYTVVLVPTVLAELDKLKIVHRDEQFRKKVTSVINRIKGLRNQGSLHEGVTTHKVVTVKMVANEPDFAKVPSWLDATNDDDRIIASVFELQRQNPNASVVLMTADVNHQNKAEAAMLPFIEPPEIESI